MEQNITKPVSGNFERKTLVFLSAIFICVIISAWIYSMKLRQTISASNAVVNIDVRALVEIEKIRNVAESQISNSLSFFLLGSTTLFDEQKKDKQTLTEALAKFEKEFSLPQVPEILKRIEGLEQQQQEFFDQAMEFRSKQTESKIVGQFYRSKTSPLRSQISKALDEIVVLHNAELDRARERAREAAIAPEIMIPRGMTLFTSLLGALFLGMVLLVLRMLSERSRQLAERTRLYEEAKKAVLSRDEVIAAVSQDFKEPLTAINQASEKIATSVPQSQFSDGAELIKSSALIIEDRIKDILDQTKADSSAMTLRLDQLGIDSILDDARLMLQPLAKQRDIRLEFNSVNPPALAFMDRERVMRVLANLVGNAIKFSPQNSKVVVKVRSDQQYVFVSVKDSGPGIPEKQLPEIFNHFWQARKTAEQGPGIGLAIVKTIIEAHGGTVHVESHVGHGSTFTFSLPRRRPVGAHVGRPVAASVRQTRPQSEFRDGPNP
jgi:signal transduction histidine kinase